MKLKRYDSYYDDVMMAMRVPEALHGEFCLSSDVDALEARVKELEERQVLLIESNKEHLDYEAHLKADLVTVCGEFDNVSRFSDWQPAKRVDAIVRRILNEKEEGK